MTEKFEPTTTAPLWSPDWPPLGDFRFPEIRLRTQEAGACVPACLAIVAGGDPERFWSVNSQDPRTWASALRPHGIGLAYCPSDARLVKYYHSELSEGLWLVGYYFAAPTAVIPDADGWLCSSHLVVVCAGQVYDPSGIVAPLAEHESAKRSTKRILAVIPPWQLRPFPCQIRGL